MNWFAEALTHLLARRCEQCGAEKDRDELRCPQCGHFHMHEEEEPCWKLCCTSSSDKP